MIISLKFLSACVTYSLAVLKSLKVYIGKQIFIPASHLVTSCLLIPYLQILSILSCYIQAQDTNVLIDAPLKSMPRYSL